MKLGGLDIGTTGCKVSIYDETGEFLAQSYCEYESTRNTETQEIDGAAVWNGVKKVLLKAKAEVGQIDAIGVSSFGESFVMLDEDDNILLPSFLYTDKRGNEECTLFDAEETIRIAGVKPHGMYSLPKLMWIKKNLPEIYKKTKRILLFEDFIVYKLTKKAQIDYSLACRTMGFDIRTKTWSKALFDVAGIDIEKMSEPVVGGTIAGKIVDAELDMTDTLVVSGCHDQLASLIGAGVLDTGSAVDGTGTVECITPVFDDIPNQKEFYEQGYCTVPHILDGKYICYVLSFTGGAALKWYKDTFIEDKSYREMDETIPAEPTGILVVPYFAGAATPFMDENAKAIFTGVTLGTTKEDMYRAIMEGVTYEILFNLEHLEASGVSRTEKLYTTGGGAKSEVWLQIKADILNRELTAINAPEVGAMGTVMLATVALGVYKDLYAAKEQFVKYGKTFTPNPKRAKEYEKLMKTYRGIYRAMRPLEITEEERC
ncbi:MAG: carbohydrate kinase [Clostridia bacterium]|nr:carbohydrate kinase [Clostridia bacterium]